MAKPKKTKPPADTTSADTTADETETDAERTPLDLAAHPERFAADELVGESEYSTRQAGERESSRNTRLPGGPPERESLAVSPDGLGRHYLEEATESPGPEELDPDPDGDEDGASDLEQSATRVDAQRDHLADPLHQMRPRRQA